MGATQAATDKAPESQHFSTHESVSEEAGDTKAMVTDAVEVQRPKL